MCSRTLDLYLKFTDIRSPRTISVIPLISNRTLILMHLLPPPIPIRALHLILIIRLKLIQHRLRQSLSSQNMLLDPVRRHGADLVVHMRARGDGEDVVEFLERALFRFGQPEEDHEEGERVEGGVEPECTYRGENVSKGFVEARRWRWGGWIGLPCGFNALSMSGNVRDSTAAQKLLVATAQLIPTSRCERGKTSAEYVKGTGPSPGE